VFLLGTTVERGLLRGVIASFANSDSSWSELELEPQKARYLLVMCLW
jgi:hypothetical protein